VSNVSLMPVPAEQPATNCANCGAALVADQRYCLSCGQPCSPVRLAFLDVLQSDQGRSGGHAPPAWGVPGTIDLGPAGYLPVHSQQGLNGWLRRNSGLLGLVAVLLMCLFVGLLVGHWASQSKSPGTQVYKIEGLGSVGSAGTAAATGAAAKSSPTATTASKSSSGQASKEAAEGAKETKAEKVLPTKTKKVTPTKLKKLSSTTGKQHQKEINELGDEPVEVGGG
jgi:hypothetical protein